MTDDDDGWFTPRRQVIVGFAALALLLLFLVAGLAAEPEEEREVARPTATAERATPQPTAVRVRATPAVRSTPRPTARPIATPVRRATPEPTVSPADVFELWYLANGYPADAYAAALDFVANGCRSLRGGATQEELFLTIMLTADEGYWEMFAQILGAGVASFCPDQSHKIG